MKKSILLIVIATFLLLFSSCAQHTSSDSSPSQNSASLSQTPEALQPSPPSVENSPVSTDTAQSLSAEDQKLNFLINDFINKNGEYSDETIKTKMFWDMDNESNYSPGTASPAQLGVCAYEKKANHVECQGILLSSKNAGDDIILIAGFENQEQKRFVTGIIFDPYWIYKGDIGFTNHKEPLSIKSETEGYFIQKDELNKLNGRPILFDVILKQFSDKVIDSKIHEIKNIKNFYSREFWDQLDKVIDKNLISYNAYINRIPASLPGANDLVSCLWMSEKMKSRMTKYFGIEQKADIDVKCVNNAADINNLTADGLPVVCHLAVWGADG